ncbi:MAG TPA: HAD-IC family P-type ATPase [Candidatus Binatia bacterium]|jgi:H+-transporting ATPase|nr:HAD-IC family P-type ATPase [Candidatus Binatia bacterium]
MHSTYQGLSQAEAEDRLRRHGPNEIVAGNDPAWKRFAKWTLTPITFMLLAASALSFFLGKDFDGGFILALLALNVGLGAWQEHKADSAIEELNQKLRVETRVFRDGVWRRIDSRELVPGDVFEVAGGEIVTADGSIIEAKNATFNESALTGESVHKEKVAGDKIFSGSFVTTGLARVRATATGKESYFGRVLFSVDRTQKRSILEQDVLRITRFLTVIALGAALVLTALFAYVRAPLAEIATLDLSLLIAGIPISLPTVMILIIEFGVVTLSKKGVVVRRISALEDLANVNLLLTDKTGTMTKGEIEVYGVNSYGDVDEREVLRYAAASAAGDGHGAIDQAIAKRVNADAIALPRVDDFIPADPERKRSTAFFVDSGVRTTVAVGAPQIVAGLCGPMTGEVEGFAGDVREFAAKGYRTVAVAVRRGAWEEKGMTLVGVLALSDALREDAAETVKFMRDKGIAVKLITGDNAAISAEIARQLALSGDKVVISREYSADGWDSLDKNALDRVSAFSEILPHEKRAIVRQARKYYVVAAAGDGVNDLPSLREANVGIAVRSAVDALRASADIVLLTDGISVIKDAIIESRRIFARIYSYSIYRISESFRLIATILFLGFATGTYPLTPIQIILLALLNDVPIVSLAFDKVKATGRPSRIRVNERFLLSTLYGTVGLVNSIVFFFLLRAAGIDASAIQTAFFLKLTVSGHMLIYVAHTKERWWRYLPSKEVIAATTVTQLVATVLALTGFLMPSRLSPVLVIIIWGWAFSWMQVSEAMKKFRKTLRAREG